VSPASGRLLAGLLALAAAALPGAAAAQSPYDEVAQTPHNFLGAMDLREVCLSCHLSAAVVPGAEEKLLAPTPLWGGGTQYDGAYPVGSITAAGTYEEFPDTSGACLECHDGVLATSVHQDEGPVARERGGTRPPNHPIRIVYPRGVNGTFVVPTPLPQNRQFWSIPDIRAGELHLPTGPVSSYQPLPAADKAQLTFSLVRSRDGKVACESCHNPHSDRIPPFLRSLPPDLCLTCHNK
jgi:predicted CXXCH cytochrome family protein